MKPSPKLQTMLSDYEASRKAVADAEANLLITDTYKVFDAAQENHSTLTAKIKVEVDNVLGPLYADLSMVKNSIQEVAMEGGDLADLRVNQGEIEDMIKALKDAAYPFVLTKRETRTLPPFGLKEAIEAHVANGDEVTALIDRGVLSLKVSKLAVMEGSVFGKTAEQHMQVSIGGKCAEPKAKG